MGEVLSFKPLGSQHIDGRAQLIQLSPSPRFFDMSFALFSLVSSSIRGLTTLPPYATVVRWFIKPGTPHISLSWWSSFSFSASMGRWSPFWGSPSGSDAEFSQTSGKLKITILIWSKDHSGIETDGFGSKWNSTLFSQQEKPGAHRCSSIYWPIPKVAFTWVNPSGVGLSKRYVGRLLTKSHRPSASHPSWRLTYNPDKRTPEDDFIAGICHVCLVSYEFSGLHSTENEKEHHRAHSAVRGHMGPNLWESFAVGFGHPTPGIPGLILKDSRWHWNCEFSAPYCIIWNTSCQQNSTSKHCTTHFVSDLFRLPQVWTQMMRSGLFSMTLNTMINNTSCSAMRIRCGQANGEQRTEPPGRGSKCIPHSWRWKLGCTVWTWLDPPRLVLKCHIVEMGTYRTISTEINTIARSSPG